MKSFAAYIQEGNQVGRYEIKPGTTPIDVSSFVFDGFGRELKSILFQWHGIKTEFFYNVIEEKKRGAVTTWKVEYKSEPIEVEDRRVAAVFSTYHIETQIEFWYNEAKCEVPDSFETIVHFIANGMNIGSLFHGRKFVFYPKMFRTTTK